MDFQLSLIELENQDQDREYEVKLFSLLMGNNIQVITEIHFLNMVTSFQ